MSHSLYALRSSLASLHVCYRLCLHGKFDFVSFLFKSHGYSTGTRGYAQIALKASADIQPEDSPTLESTNNKSLRQDPVWGHRERFGQVAQPTPLSKLKPQPHFATHLNTIFQPLEFHPEISRRCLTHASHPSSINGHNAGMTFLGSLNLFSASEFQHWHHHKLTCTRPTSAGVIPAPLSHLQQSA